MPTLCEAFQDFLSSKSYRSAKTGHAYRRAIEHYLADWVSRPLNAIERRQAYFDLDRERRRRAQRNRRNAATLPCRRTRATPTGPRATAANGRCCCSGAGRQPHGRRRVGILWDFAGGRRGLHRIRRAAVRRRSPGTGQRALDARHAVTQYVQVATHFGHVGSERVDLAAQTRPLPFNLTAQGCPLPTNHRHQYGQHCGHRSHRAEQHGNSVRHRDEHTATGPLARGSVNRQAKSTPRRR